MARITPRACITGKPLYLPTNEGAGKDLGLKDLFGMGGLRCPRDHAKLQHRDEHGTRVERCGTCGGIWLDAKQLRRITDGGELAKADAWAGQYPTPSGFACPSCEGPCCGTFLEEFSVHTCTRCHGVWMDKAEVEGARRQIAVQHVVRTDAPELRAFLQRL